VGKLRSIHGGFGPVVLATAMLAAPVLGGTIRTAETARAAGLASSANTGFDVDIQPPDQLNLTAPPSTVPGDPGATVTYGHLATLLEVRDGTRALNAGLPHAPVAPAFGRWVGVKVRETDTGSTDTGIVTLRVAGTDGKTYYPQDPTMPGCAPRETFPPQPLPPRHTFTGCDTFDLPSKVGVRAITVNFGGWHYASANGRWNILDRRPAAKRLKYVALGDSYSSGEGSGDYDTTWPGHCHRGAGAWPRQVARDLPGLLDLPARGFIACSGADSAALTGAAVPAGEVDQVARLHAIQPTPAVITVTVGGNDIGFTDILANCWLKDCVKNRTLAKAETEAAKERRTLVSNYSAIARFAPHAHLVVVGYPRIFPRRQADLVLPQCRLGIAHLGLGDAERQGLNKLDANLNKIIREAARHEGAAYVPVTNALTGHEACTRHPWIVSDAPPKGQEEGHPTLPGQAAIARIVFTYLVNRFGA
jgi:lysophospholipase L1-like esterase